MIAKARGTVTIPKNPRSLGSILQWCGEVSLAIQQLRDRAIVVKAGGTSAASASCANLKIKVNPLSTPEARTYLISTGQIGDVIIAEQAVAAGDVYATITLDDTDGTYTATITTECTASDTITCILLGTIVDDVITQIRCGPIAVSVCRNWFAAEAPFYSIAAA